VILVGILAAAVIAGRSTLDPGASDSTLSKRRPDVTGADVAVGRGEAADIAVSATIPPSPSGHGCRSSAAMPFAVPSQLFGTRRMSVPLVGPANWAAWSGGGEAGSHAVQPRAGINVSVVLVPRQRHRATTTHVVGRLWWCLSQPGPRPVRTEVIVILAQSLMTALLYASAQRRRIGVQLVWRVIGTNMLIADRHCEGLGRLQRVALGVTPLAYPATLYWSSATPTPKSGLPVSVHHPDPGRASLARPARRCRYDALTGHVNS